MNKKDNAVVVVQKLINHYNIPISDQTIAEDLMSHPEYPSLKSICDALGKWKIEYYPVRINRDLLKKTDTPFIAHLNDDGDKLVFVPKLNGDSKVKYYDSSGKSKSIRIDAFFNKYSGVSLLIDPDENAGEDKYSEKRQNNLLNRGLPYLAGFALILFVVYSILSYENRLNIFISNAALLVTKLVGLFFSILLVLKDLNVSSSLVETLCNFNKKINCKSILNTAAAKVFGWLHWSDVGLIYFLSGLSIMISSSDKSDYDIIAILSFGVLGYVLFSFYYQAVIAKTWCPLCLGVQLILILEAVLSFSSISLLEVSDFSIISILKYGSIIFTTIFWVTLFKAYVINKRTLNQKSLAYLILKRNPDVFTNLLLKGEQKKLSLQKEIMSIGAPKARIEVTAFLSLDCPPCQKAFNQLKILFDKREVKINLIFSLEDDLKPFMNQVTQLFREKRHQEAIKLLDKWYNIKDNEKTLMLKKAKERKYNGWFKTVYKAHRDLFKEAGIPGTPTIFVNGYGFPKEYEIKDIAYFIDVLKK